MKMQSAIAAMIVTGGLAGMAHGALLAQEGFAPGVSSGWSTSFASGNATGLTKDPLTTTGADANESRSVASGQDTRGVLTASASGTVWVSWLYRPGNANEFGGLRISNGTDPINAAQVWVSPRTAGSGLLSVSSRGTSGGNQAFSTGQTLSFGTTYLLALKIDTVAKTYDLWVDPTLGVSGPGTATLSLAGSQLPTASIAVNSIGILGGGSGGAVFDEIRVGQTFADVAPVPEPASLSLVGLLAAAGLRRRRQA